MKKVLMIFVMGVLLVGMIGGFVGAEAGDGNGNGDGNQNQENINSEDDGVCDENCQERERNRNRNLTQEQKKEIVQERKRIHFEANTGVECPEGCSCQGGVVKCMLEDGSREMTVYAGNSGNKIVIVKGVNMTTQVTLYHHNGSVYGIFAGNKTREVKIFPDEVKEKVREKIRQKNCECEEIELGEEGVYDVQARKRARLFGMFPVRERVRMQIDSGTGEMIKTKTSWWGFLARDVVEEELVGESCGTVTPGMNDECCQNKGYASWDEDKFECVDLE